MALTCDLTGKVALITGGASGIGAGVAKSFLGSGARVVINFLYEKDREAVSSLVLSTGGTGEGYRADVSAEEEVDDMIKFVAEKYGRLDILVNNAGIAYSSPVESIQTAQWLETFNVHVNGTFFCTRASLPYMYRQNYGRIINTSSQLAYKGAPEFSHYSAAKGAIISFTRSLALEIGERNICANTVAPGATKTPILKDVPADILEGIRAGIPRKTLAEIDDIVGTYLFLASDAANHYRGQCLSPNGGDVFL